MAVEEPDIQLGIISIAKKKQLLSADDMSKGEHVDGKQDGAKNLSLWNTTGDKEAI